MIQGTMSNAGKSLLCAGLCRIFKQDGYRVAPFKSQNMALNSYITKDGLEMGRAQVMQAEAAGIEPEAAMNPILLKPTSNMGSQLIVNGEVRGNYPAAEYFKMKKSLIPEIKKHGTRVFVDSDGDVTRAVPWFRGAGVEGILPLERQSGVDVAAIRREYPDFLMIGGFDKMCMFEGPDAVRREFERLLPVIRSGRYLPAMDHQTPPGTTLETYRAYARMLREYGTQACKDC